MKHPEKPIIKPIVKVKKAKIIRQRNTKKAANPILLESFSIQEHIPSVEKESEDKKVSIQVY